MKPTLGIPRVSMSLLLGAALLAASTRSTADDRGPAAAVPLETPWLAGAERGRLRNLDIALEDQDGRSRKLEQLVNQPTLLTFFYSRCQNTRKCSTTVSQLAALQRQLADAGMAEKVRLVAITFEPQFDTPERIARYSTSRGLKLGEHALGGRLDEARHRQLIDELRVPVSYNAGWVSTHGVDAALLDHRGRLVRKYVTLVWNNDHVVADLKRLVGEQSGEVAGGPTR